jgi:hypothetical protein
MARSSWRILLVPLLLVLLAGLIASAQAGSTCADGRKTDEELVRIATHDLVHELREAAARALLERLAGAFKEGEPPSVAYLEGLVGGPSPELRQWVAGLLSLSIMVELSRGELPIDQLILGIYTGETAELRQARAWGVMLALFAQEALGISPESLARKAVEGPREIMEIRLAPELALDLLRRLEGLLRGREEELWGYHFDGSVEAIRGGAYLLAVALLHMKIGHAPYRLHPCEGWFELAERGETAELRSIASHFYFEIGYCAPPDPEALRALAAGGASPEARFFAAMIYVEREVGGRRLGLAGLIDLALHGESEELREAASFFLEGSFLEALLDKKITIAELYELALRGETPQLRSAAGFALGNWWRFRLRGPSWAGRPEELKISDIPRQSPAEPHSLEQALIIFAVENTVAHPELAGAAILPLIYIWGE